MERKDSSVSSDDTPAPCRALLQTRMTAEEANGIPTSLRTFSHGKHHQHMPGLQGSQGSSFPPPELPTRLSFRPTRTLQPLPGPPSPGPVHLTAPTVACRASAPASHLPGLCSPSGDQTPPVPRACDCAQTQMFRIFSGTLGEKSVSSQFPP